MKSLLLMLVTIMLTGCSHLMSDTNMQLVDKNISYTLLKEKPESLVGKIVITGGVIAGLHGFQDLSEIEVMQLELLENGLPDEFSASKGRFFGISREILDPMLYRNGSLVTLIGEVKGKKTAMLEGREYNYPVISIKEIRSFRPSSRIREELPNPYFNNNRDRMLLEPPGLPEGEPKRLP